MTPTKEIGLLGYIHPIAKQATSYRLAFEQINRELEKSCKTESSFTLAELVEKKRQMLIR